MNEELLFLGNTADWTKPGQTIELRDAHQLQKHTVGDPVPAFLGREQ